MSLIPVEPPSTPVDKADAAEKAFTAVEKEYGKGSVFSMRDRKGLIIPSIRTGIFPVDYTVLGCGGMPRGRICEIYGPEAGGKTTLTLQLIAEAQRNGGKAAFIDAEHALDANWATTVGVNVDDLLVSQPDYGEQALGIAQILLESRAFDIVAVDSVAALIPKAELDGDIEDSHMGLQARLMGKAMRKLTGVTAKADAVLVFINQIREKLGVTFGSPETTPGGRALKFFASVRLDVRRIGQVKDGEKLVGNKVRIRGSKNKVGAPFREAEVDLMFDRGFDGVGSLVDVATGFGVVEKSGSWFSYKGERLGQGRLNAIQAVRDRELYEQLLQEVLAERELVK
jgi:recombination protein RecA